MSQLQAQANPEPSLETAACLCGKDADARRIASVDPLTNAAWTYLRCGACGLERLSPRPPISDMGRHYPADYTPFNDASAGTSRIDRLKRLVYQTYFASPAERPQRVRRLRPILRLLLLPLRQHSILSFAPPEKRQVFEFGAGSGADLAEFKWAGWSVAGCEPSATGCANAARQGITLTQGTAEEAIVPEGTSCIYFNNVLEHLHDPLGVLTRARQRMAPGGLAVIVVPNHQSVAARLFAGAWPGYDPPRHLWGFTPSTLRALLERAGFESVELSQKYPLSTYCWADGLRGGRGTPARPRAFRLAAASGKALLAGGMLAAWLGRADYIRAVAKVR